MQIEDLSLFETSGFSMWPFMRQGEKLVIKKISIQDLRIGDVILYRKDNQLVCHRLIKKIKDNDRYLLYTRGDNTDGLPEVVTEEMFLGRASGLLRKNGGLTNLTGKKQQFINHFIVVIAPWINRLFRIIKPWIRFLR